MSSKIALGTVQFGLDYGINNLAGQIPRNEVFEILEFAHKNGICMLDTAAAYGNSETIIGNFISKTKIADFKIISKYSSMEVEEDEINEAILVDSIKKLNVKSLYGYLAHDFKKFRNNVKQIKKFLDLKKTGLINKIGFSFYNPQDLQFLIENKIEFDIIQIPYNVFDRRFESYFTILKEKNVEIHIRSCFLQGLVFMKPEKLPVNLVGISHKLSQLQSIAANSNISIHFLCLSFCLANTNIDKVILGVDSLQNLKDNISNLNNKTEQTVTDQLCALKEENESLILPINW